MSVQNIECQLAKGQIGRYLAGDPFSPEALKQLEGHIAECEHCTELVSERKAALLSMLGGAPATHAVVEVPVEPRKSTSIGEAIRQRLIEEQKIPKPAPQPEPKTAEKIAVPPSSTDFKKPLMYSVGLAIVLIGMSYASKSASSFFGPKVAETAPAIATPTNPISTAPPPTENTGGTPAAISTPPAADPAPITNAPPQDPEPKIEKPVAPKQPAAEIQVKQTTPRRTTKRSTTNRRRSDSAKPVKSSSGIKVYDASGKPITR